MIKSSICIYNSFNEYIIQKFCNQIIEFDNMMFELFICLFEDNNILIISYFNNLYLALNEIYNYFKKNFCKTEIFFLKYKKDICLYLMIISNKILDFKQKIIAFNNSIDINEKLIYYIEKPLFLILNKLLRYFVFNLLNSSKLFIEFYNFNNILYANINNIILLNNRLNEYLHKLSVRNNIFEYRYH